MQVVPINPAGNQANSEHTERERRLRRLAMQIVVQLPEDEQEALAVLRQARELVKSA